MQQIAHIIYIINIKKEYKKYKINKFKQNNKIPNWMDNKNLCNADYMTDKEEIKFREELFK